MMRHLVRTLTVAAVMASSGTVAHSQVAPAPAAKTVTRESAGTVGPNAAAAKKSLPTEVTIQREVFDYSGSGRRDPYKSLMKSSDVRPLISDLRLTAVILDVSGSDNSVAILRDTFSKQQYRIRIGQQLGRLRVSAIKQKAVQFTVEEFGFNRTETLPISSDTTKVRNP